jgi:hypothetical protein
MNMTVFTSVARTATENSIPQGARGHRGVRLTLDITAASGTNPTLDVKVQSYNETGDDWVDLPGAAFAQKTTTGTDDLTVYPGIAETANRSVSDVLSTTWRAVATIAGTGPSFTFSLGADLID